MHLATHGFFLDALPDTTNPDKRGVVIAFPSPDSANRPPPAVEGSDPLLRAGLAFSGANLGVKGEKQADGSDGILTALEVLELDLAGTDLVVLSACETGLGDIHAGEGVYGLRRAFQEAGAKAVLSSLWSISDEATRDFMQSFYRKITSGASPHQALQAVQSEFQNNPKYAHPFFWAPFVLVENAGES